MGCVSLRSCGRLTFQVGGAVGGEVLGTHLQLRGAGGARGRGGAAADVDACRDDLGAHDHPASGRGGVGGGRMHQHAFDWSKCGACKGDLGAGPSGATRSQEAPTDL